MRKEKEFFFFFYKLNNEIKEKICENSRKGKQRDHYNNLYCKHQLYTHYIKNKQESIRMNEYSTTHNRGNECHNHISWISE